MLIFFFFNSVFFCLFQTSESHYFKVNIFTSIMTGSMRQSILLVLAHNKVNLLSYLITNQLPFWDVIGGDVNVTRRVKVEETCRLKIKDTHGSKG